MAIQIQAGKISEIILGDPAFCLQPDRGCGTFLPSAYTALTPTSSWLEQAR
jgi:hypothetical protein